MSTIHFFENIQDQIEFSRLVQRLLSYDQNETQAYKYWSTIKRDLAAHQDKLGEIADPRILQALLTELAQHHKERNKEAFSKAFQATIVKIAQHRLNLNDDEANELGAEQLIIEAKAIIAKDITTYEYRLAAASNIDDSSTGFDLDDPNLVSDNESMEASVNLNTEDELGLEDKLRELSRELSFFQFLKAFTNEYQDFTKEDLKDQRDNIINDLNKYAEQLHHYKYLSKDENAIFVEALRDVKEVNLDETSFDDALEQEGEVDLNPDLSQIQKVFQILSDTIIPKVNQNAIDSFIEEVNSEIQERSVISSESSESSEKLAEQARRKPERSPRADSNPTDSKRSRQSWIDEAKSQQRKGPIIGANRGQPSEEKESNKKKSPPTMGGHRKQP